MINQAETGGTLLREPGVTVRIITKDNIKEAQRFLLQQCKDLYGRDFSSTKNRDIWELEQTYLTPARNCMWAAFTPENILVGTIAASPFNDRFLHLRGRYLMGATVEIGRCYVQKGLRRQGIGSLLFKSMHEFCKEQQYRTMYLHTHKFLPGGFTFWQKHGFMVTIDEDDTYETVHMEKGL